MSCFNNSEEKMAYVKSRLFKRLQIEVSEYQDTPYQNLNKNQTFSTQARIANDLQTKRFGYFSTFLFYEHHRN